ncbi:MAG: CPBP family intramembrane metalloprotease, partial [Prevotellaceae bacterium]|nr:CPBP family intramembrane metalloprotease [Prevotellaceae bacterium]
CGWLGVLVDKFAPPQPGGETLGMAIWLVLPLLTTIALRFFAGDGWKDLGWKLNLKGNAKWYAAALLIYPLVTAVVLALGKMLGWISFSSFDAEAYAVGFVAALLPNLVKNFFEESVWRGYLTAKLLKTKIKDGWLYLIVGGVWSVWHLPYYLHFLPQADMYLILPVERLTFAIVAIASMICWTVMFVELYRLTKSIWSVVLLHVVEDSLINHLIIDGHVAIAAGKEIWISPIAGIITSLLYLGIGMWLRQRRVGSKM